MSPVRLVVVLPGLLPPRDADATARGSTAAPHLARLVAISGKPLREHDGIAAALARIYGVARQSDWPLAAILVAALGIDPGDDYWLAADPVTLVAGRDDVRLDGPVTDLAPDEAAMLIAMLNDHFAADGLTFIAPRPSAWFVHMRAAPAIVTRPLAAASGRTLRALLPSGPDAGRWRRWQNEIQMLLHEHPANAAREREGRPLANSVWFWGGGTRPPPSTPSIGTYATGGLAAAFAAHAGTMVRALPPALDAVLADAGGAATALVALNPPIDVADAERAWAKPAWTALARGRLGAVTLIADGDGGAVCWTAERPGAWQRLAARYRTPDLATLLTAAGDVSAPDA